MPKAKNTAANFEPMLESTGDALTEEEKAAQLAEERGETPAAPEQPEGEGQQAAEQPEAEGKGKGKKTPTAIPYDRFQEVVEERNRIRQEAEQARQEAAQQREQWARLQERQRMAEEAQNRAAQAAQAAERAKLRPDPDVDPAGARAWDFQQEAAQLREQLGQLTQFVSGRSQELQGWTQQQEHMQWVGSQAQVARMQYGASQRGGQSHYDDIVDACRASRREYWKGVCRNDQMAANIVANEEAALTALARQNGVALGPEVIRMAQQWGIVNPDLTWRQATAPAPNGNGNTRVNGNTKLDQIAAGQKVQGLGRTQSAETPSQKQWQVMEDKEFAMFIAGMDDQDFIDMSRDKAFNKRVASLDMGA